MLVESLVMVKAQRVIWQHMTRLIKRKIGELYLRRELSKRNYRRIKVSY
jgi:hypothetical protein